MLWQLRQVERMTLQVAKLNNFKGGFVSSS